MARMLKRVLLFGGLFCLLSFTVNSDKIYEGVNVKKTITQVKEHLFELSILVENGDKINGIAKYEAKLPLTADFVKEVSKDKAVKFSIDGRKVKMIWMHLRKNESYEAVFQFRSKLSINKLRMTGKLMGHENGAKVTYADNSSLKLFNAE